MLFLARPFLISTIAVELTKKDEQRAKRVVDARVAEFAGLVDDARAMLKWGPPSAISEHDVAAITARVGGATACAVLDLASGVSEIAASTRLSRQTIYRIRDDRAGAEPALANWTEKR